MSRKFKIRDQEAVHFVTFTTIQWLDIFTRAEYRDIFLDSIRYCQKNKGLEVYAYCIMSSHVHMIVARHGAQPLEHVIRDIKKFTSLKIIEAINGNQQESRRELLMWLFERAGTRNPNNTRYQFWQQHSHPIELNTNEKLNQRLDYIHNNPVVAGIVRYPEDYLYSSAGNYAKLPENVLDVMLIQFCNASLSEGLRTPSEKTVMMKGTSEPRTCLRTTLAPVTVNIFRYWFGQSRKRLPFLLSSLNLSAVEFMPNLSFEIDTAKKFYLKLLEDYEDFQKNDTSSRIAINCAMTAFHLSEWIYHEYKLGSKYSSVKKFQEALEATCSELKVMHGITNGSKHYHLRLSLSTGLHGGAFSRGFSNGFDTSYLYTKQNGNMVGFEDQLSTVVGFWKNFFIVELNETL